jgi:hypothetical protein
LHGNDAKIKEIVDGLKAELDMKKKQEEALNQVRADAANQNNNTGSMDMNNMGNGGQV